MDEREIIQVAAEITELGQRERELLGELETVRTKRQAAVARLQQAPSESAPPPSREHRTPRTTRTEDSAKDRVRKFVIACAPGAKLTSTDVTTALGIPAVLAGNYLSRLAADGAILTREGRGTYVVTSSKSN